MGKYLELNFDNKNDVELNEYKGFSSKTLTLHEKPCSTVQVDIPTREENFKDMIIGQNFTQL